VVSIPLVFLGMSLFDRFGVESSLNQFCGAEEEGRYSDAYQFLSQRLR
jgi:hypothetical protein